LPGEGWGAAEDSSGIDIGEVDGGVGRVAERDHERVRRHGEVGGEYLPANAVRSG
jgi:hypothetical protein